MIDRNNYCMEFSNEEIINYLVKPLEIYPQLEIRILSDDDIIIHSDSEDQIKYIILDGDKEEFYVDFYGFQTSVFAPGQDSNKEFMFIDDRQKDEMSTSHTHGNVVYEGMLCDKTHKEILELVLEFIRILIGSEKIDIKETVVSQIKWYNKCDYVVRITNVSGIKNEVVFKNIRFVIN